MSMHKLFMSKSEAKPSFASKSSVAYTVLKDTRLSDAPYVEAQEELEILFDKNQRYTRIKAAFDCDEFIQKYESSGIPTEISKEFCIGVCVQMAIHKRASASILIGALYFQFMDSSGNHIQAMQACGDALELAIEYDFVDYSLDREEFIIRLELTSDVIKDIERFQYPLPMVVQPKKLKHNRTNGYLSEEASRSMIVLKAGRSKPFYEMADLCLDHLDRMNKIPLTLNTQVAELIDNSWSDLDKKRPNETHEEYQKRVRAFERYDENSKDVIYALTQLRDTFWLTHKYDRRGRTYCQGYHVNYQGNPWNKAVVEFANKEMVL